MKNLIDKNITKPVNIDGQIKIATEESIEQLAWTAAMPKGELEKLKKVCKPVAAKNGLVFWVVDNTKATFIQK
tara:strand:+ start:1548 stop:1766 length:219 start_codon:yes stop_codon:yes gene_type:complete